MQRLPILQRDTRPLAPSFQPLPALRPTWRRAGSGFFLAIAALAGTPSAQAQAVQVPTAALSAGEASTNFSLVGSLQAVRQTTLAAQVGGNLTVLAVKAGDRVKAGQLIARIDERSADAGLRASGAAVEQAQAQSAQARQQLDRTRELRQQGFISQAAVDSAENQFRAAQAGLDQAQANRGQAALARGFATVTAPFDGIVQATHLEAGELALPGRALVTLYAPERLRAVVELPSSRAAAARAATTVEVALPDGRSVSPASRNLLPSTDPVAQTVEWRLELPPAAAAGAAPGQSVLVRFSAAAASQPGAAARPRLPVQAVLQRGELSAVYVVQDGRFALRPVRVGADGGAGSVELIAGLKPGERYATDAVRAGLAGAVPAR
ncbi:MAG: efflux RND transporter periplasmic adaptor subunit [Rubrivivax sp.]|nr:efflux RND transporter periplasmic adaptor subunit [Rubrivivax sp.]